MLLAQSDSKLRVAMTGQSPSASMFEADDYPNGPRVLFVGWPESSHTHSWVDLVQKSRINTRLFALTVGCTSGGVGAYGHM